MRTRKPRTLYIIAGLSSIIAAKLLYRDVVQERERSGEDVIFTETSLTTTGLKILSLPAENRLRMYLPPSNRRSYQQYLSAAFSINEEVSEEVLRACQKRMYVLQSLLRTITILHQNIQGTYTVDTSMIDTTLKVDLQIPITYPDIHPSLM